MKITALRSIGTLVISLMAAGCVSVTAPVQTGPDTYMIGLGAHGGFSSDADLMVQSIKSAGDFCAAQGRQLQVISSSSSGTQGWTPQSNQVVFKCLHSS